MQLQAHINRWLAAHGEEMVQWRRHLHAHPELSHMEHSTTDFIATTLQTHGLAVTRFPGTGLMVDIGPASGDRIAIRADIDALPITEASGEPFTSTVAGVMHACGHDLHTAIVMGLACALADAPLTQPVRCIFQPAEEVMDGGAPQVISWGALDDVAAIFAAHAEPKLRTGTIGLRTGAITSASDVLEVKVHGPGGHTSRPQITADVVYALSSVVTQLPALLSRRIDPRTGTVLVFGTINAGYAANAIPESGSISGTVRTADIATWRTIEQTVRQLIADILAPTGVTHEVVYTKGVPPVVNDEVATAFFAHAATSIDPHAVVQAPQSSGGEDFSWYLEHVPGSMARLGCWNGQGEKPDLHRADLVVDERALEVGVRLFGSVVAAWDAGWVPTLQPAQP
ncbi:amidohydrolase [Corynebacterium choanae]|uniref:Putative hydrolase YxeP n=1 Tax=Corynebacterium choanae TaxID=1862358 RepID=A0A3G6J8T8_9CORY|nr:amidohydrolase [Corynebacterium choanae]AZA14193.1 putative hydrolase YxeP [Corynebacterium choanae]